MQRILLVEDEVIIAMAEASLLRRSGYEVRVVHSGEAALEAVHDPAGPPDLILMDVDLGRGIDGTETASAILSHHDIPVLFVSSHTDREMVERTERISSFGYVVKNSGDTVLLASIKMAFRLHEAYHALKEQREELRSTNEKYRRSQLRARIGSWEHDFVADRLWWSEGMYAMLGFAPDTEITIDRILPCFPTADQERFSMAVQRAVEHDEPYSMDYTFNRPDGTALMIHDEGTIIRGDGGQPLHMYGTTQDVTDMWEAQKHLRELSCSVEQSPATVVITDLVGTIEYVNPKFTETTGYAASEVIGKNPRVLKSGETSAEEYRMLWETITSGKEWRGEFHNRRKDGSLYWESASISPITDGDGRITHFVAVKEDITARKRAERQLRVNDQLLKTIATFEPYHVVVQDADLRYTMVLNPQLGLTEADMLGKHDHDFLGKEDADKLTEVKRRVLESGASIPYSSTVVSTTGKIEAFDGTYVPNRAADGSIEGVIGYFRNVTKEREAEARLQQALKDRDLLMKELEHRVKNTLAMVSSLLGLETPRLTDAAARNVFVEMQGRIHALAGVYEQLHTTDSPGSVNLATYVPRLARKVFDAYTRVGDNLTLQTNVDTVCVPLQLAIPLCLILNEALTNVARHAYPAGGGGAARVTVRAEDHELRMSIEDDGPGLTDTHASGMTDGLGLRLIRLLATQLGGACTIDAARGTSLCVTVPR